MHSFSIASLPRVFFGIELWRSRPSPQMSVLQLPETGPLAFLKGHKLGLGTPAFIKAHFDAWTATQAIWVDVVSATSFGGVQVGSGDGRAQGGNTCQMILEWRPALLHSHHDVLVSCAGILAWSADGQHVSDDGLGARGRWGWVGAIHRGQRQRPALTD